ncbi:MAG: hypothetical protein IKS66_08290, partial [Oscillospiraceae bacterium]|nr:hypothetical protein [Oscillospiraceae bacterium]
RERLLNSRQRSLTVARRDFTRLTAALDALSPLKVLCRGYAIAAAPDGRVLRSVADSAPGAAVRVTLSDGALDCRVEDIERKETEHGRAEGTGL